MKNVISKINLNQNINNCPYESLRNYVGTEIVVGECYYAFVGQNKDHINIIVTEIEEVEEDYLIRGIDIENKKVELKLSEVSFWIS